MSDRVLSFIRPTSTRSLICALLLLASVFTLTKALTEPVVITEFSKIGDMVRSLYPESDFYADNADKTAKDYEQLVDLIDGGAQMVLSLSGRAQEIYDDLTTPKAYTVTSGARQLFEAGDIIPALLILVFSVIMPIGKTALMFFVHLEPALHNGPPKGAKVLKFLNLSHKYTMLDVFVVAITVFAFSEQALVSVKPANAVYWYLAYMVASYIALWLLEKTAPASAPKHQPNTVEP